MLAQELSQLNEGKFDLTSQALPNESIHVHQSVLSRWWAELSANYHKNLPIKVFKKFLIDKRIIIDK